MLSDEHLGLLSLLPLHEANRPGYARSSVPSNPSQLPQNIDLLVSRVPSVYVALWFSSFTYAFDYQLDMPDTILFLTAFTTICTCSTVSSGYMGNETIRS